MVRIKRGNVARKRRKKILQLAKGYRGAHSRLFRVANQQVMKALRYSYIGRKQKKRTFRRLWITRINAASKLNGLSYSRVISNLKKSIIDLNRKMLSQIAVLDAPAFGKLIEISKGKVAAFIFVINLFDLGGSDNLVKNNYKVENLINFPGH